MKQILKLSTLLVAGLLFNSCSDSNDDGPTYNLPEGLHMYALEAETGALLQHHAGDAVNLVFYGEPSAVFALENAIVKVRYLSEVPFKLGIGESGVTGTITKIWTEYPPKVSEFPHIENGDPFTGIPIQLSKDSRVYDFYFEIENFVTGISFRTPNYRITIHYEYEGQDVVQDSYTVDFTTIR